MTSAGDGSVSVEALRYFASPTISATSVNLVARVGASATGTLTLANAVAAGPISDTLLIAQGALPTWLSGATSGDTLIPGQSATSSFTISTGQSGVLTGAVTYEFTSQSDSGPDFALATKTVAVTGTVTDNAVAVLTATGGLLSFANGNYTLNLGDIAVGAEPVSAEFSIANTVIASAYSETLSGYFSGVAADGFRFSGGAAGLTGGEQSAFGILYFDRTGLSSGIHQQVIDFATFSSFAGLSDLDLGGATVTVSANVLAASTGTVPEPAVWAQMIAGFGLAGGALRHRRRNAAGSVAA